MKLPRIALAICAAALFLCTSAASAQVRVNGAIAGTVLDNTDAVVPGARVQLKDQGTGLEKETTSNDSGGFAFPDLNFGTYSLTVSLQGFNTALYRNVIVESGRTTDLRIKMATGGVDEVIQVEGAAPVLEQTSNVIATTLNNKILKQLPVGGDGRNVFTLARLVPGVVQPPAGNGTQTGTTHYNGMPGGTINPTIDGVNNASNGFKSGGTSFFGTVPARMGAIEEVTVESAGLGADAGAQGGVNLKFVTRRGTSQYHGSGFYLHRNEALNANSYFNTSRGIAKPRLRRQVSGGNIGGPLLPFGPMKDKAFFFLNFEREYIPNDTIVQNTMLTAEAEQGVFRYQTLTGEQRTVNLLQIAGANGFSGAKDPTLATLLARQTEAARSGTIGRTANLRTQTMDWFAPNKRILDFPTARADYQITPNLAWMGSWNLYRQNDQGRRNWPLNDLPIQNLFHASWWITSTGLNWTVNSRTFNEFRYGIQHSGDTTPNRGPEYFAQNAVVNGVPSRFSFPFAGMSNLTQNAAPITGRHYITTIYDVMTFLRGNHSIKVGGQYRLTDWRDTSLDGAGQILTVPNFSIGSPAGDPVQSIFNTTTMPGVQAADLADAYGLYALLTGRLTRVQMGQVVDPETGQYSDDIYRENWTSSKQGGIYAQDSWRMSPNFTLNYGLRWEFSGPPYNHTGVANFPDLANLYGPSSALFQPGVLNGVQTPTLVRGKNAAANDYVNPAPNAGFAWTPNFENGLLAKIFGKGQSSVIRGGYALTYYDEGTNMFAATAGNNPGQTQSLDLQPGFAGFTPGGLTLQSQLPGFSRFPTAYRDVFNQADFTFGNTNFGTMKDDLRTPYVQSWNIGVQREIAKNTVIEARYVGTKGSHVWRTYNINEVNVFENGFVDEFKGAQRNLAINQAAGVTSFQNLGRPGQVALPIFDAAFGARGSQAALPAASGYTNGTFITNLQQGTAGALANTLATTPNYVCRMFGNTFSPCGNLNYNAAGQYPINFFLANPYGIGGAASVVDDGSYTNYRSLQLQLRRRLSSGLSMNVNYTLAKNTGDIWADNATQTVNYRTLRDKKLDDGPTPFDVRHVVQAFGTYDLPFGSDRQFKVTNPILDGIVGGWTLGGVLQIQSGSPFRLSSGRGTVNTGDSGVILKNGLTAKDLQDMIKIGPGPGLARLFIDPKLIGPDGRANPDFIDVPTTPGEFGQFVYLYTPMNWNLDASLNKRIPISSRVNLNINITATNVLNHPVWGTGLAFLTDANITSQTFGQTLQPLNNNSSRQFFLRGELSF